MLQDPNTVSGIRIWQWWNTLEVNYAHFSCNVAKNIMHLIKIPLLVIQVNLKVITSALCCYNDHSALIYTYTNKHEERENCSSSVARTLACWPGTHRFESLLRQIFCKSLPGLPVNWKWRLPGWYWLYYPLSVEWSIKMFGQHINTQTPLKWEWWFFFTVMVET